jgi:hypothetical protein
MMGEFSKESFLGLSFKVFLLITTFMIEISAISVVIQYKYTVCNV